MEEFYFLLVIVAIGAYIYLIYKNIIKIKTEIDIFKEYIKNENVIEEEIDGQNKSLETLFFEVTEGVEKEDVASAAASAEEGGEKA